MRGVLTGLSETDRFDCCIFGTGPAGITCARALAAAGRRVLLLEAGGEDLTLESQDVYRGEVIGDPYFELDEARLRYFGGTSNHWSGWSRHLDAEDFEAKPGFPLTEWPIRRADLDPYLADALAIIEVPPIPSDEAIAGSGLARFHFGFSPPTLFAEKYGDELVAVPNLLLVLDAALFALETDGHAITGALVKGADGAERRVVADRYVLAAGGIENSRLLLWSNERANGQIVKKADALGRYWMEHPTFTIGDAVLDFDAWAFERSENTYLALSAAARAEARTLGGGLRVEPRSYAGAKKLVADIACVAPELARSVALMLERDMACGAKIRIASEQEPRAENRVALAQQKDALGMPRSVLHWRKSAADKRAIRVLAERFGAYLANTGAGRLRLDSWVLDGDVFADDGDQAGYHHMGGTRMASRADLGVVDSDCRVHGQENLYIAGSSVFPSGGHSNPTLTIVQLALRLADHLARS